MKTGATCCRRWQDWTESKLAPSYASLRRCRRDSSISLGRPEGKATKGIVEDSEFFLSPPSDFNDPFDTRARVVWEGTPDELYVQAYFTALTHGKSYEEANAIGKKIAAKPPPDFQASYDNNANQFGITCFVRSSRLDEPRQHAAHSLLMWAHDADQHRGFCFQFHVLRSPAVFGAAVPTTYSDEFANYQLGSARQSRQDAF